MLEYAHPSTPGCAVNGGYVIRDGALPSLLGRYIYADSFDVFGNELHTAQLFAGGSSGDSALGVTATHVVSFGEDACAHIYVATLGGAVYRLEPTSGAFPCMPQTPAAGPRMEPSRRHVAHGSASRGSQEVQEEGEEEHWTRKKLKKCKKKAKKLPV